MDKGDAVSVDLSQQEQELLGQVESSEQELGDLRQDLHAVDAELGELAKRNREYEILSQVCRSLDELRQIAPRAVEQQQRVIAIGRRQLGSVHLEQHESGDGHHALR